ncbi:MAG: non-heme iron oxygenase ferredoxin subunit [Gemmatimonadetes bacterium]|nr:non-heme iron oxygenase ferredoxin subunit [Gemmatimonadota bacterium]
MADWVRVADPADCPPGALLGVRAGSDTVVLANVAGDMYALEDRCSHQDFPLSDGELEGDRLECIYHGAKFDVCTGRAMALPAIRPVKTYEVDVRDDGVYLKID